MADFSVVIPAHNEERVIGRCLDGFVHSLTEGEAQIIVVPNGCTDSTADVASRYENVRVVTLAVGNKSAALNAADDVAVSFPRIYLDADIVLSISAIRALVSALATDEPRIAVPTITFIVEGRPWVVRKFYEVYEQLPYVRSGLTGGVIGVSGSGRARFGAFPDVTADDLFLQRQFSDTERIILRDHTFGVEVPHTVAGLLNIRVRTAFGASRVPGDAAGDRRDAREHGGAEFRQRTSQAQWPCAFRRGCCPRL